MAIRTCARCGFVGRAARCERCDADRAGQPDVAVVDDRYAVLDEIGRGGMGIVYRARDVLAGRDVALKLVAGDADAAHRLRREAGALSAVRSDHVVRVQAFGAYDEGFYIAMDHVAGVTLEAILARHLDRDAFVDIPRAVTIVRQIALGLGAVHAAGLSHRDVKPANIVVEKRSGRPVLVDFGLATPSEGDGRIGDDPLAETVTGTPEYMAPEQLRGHPATARSDLYSLACAAYELLTGRLPFDGETIAEIAAAHTFATPAPPSTWRRGLEPFDNVLMRALAKPPELRFPDAESFIEALDRASSRRGVFPSPIDEPAVSQPVARDDRDALTVLVVDDDDVTRKLVSRCVKLAFHRARVHIEPVASGIDALRSFRERPARLVLLDYTMPGLDGLDTLTRLRALPGGTDALVVVISGTLVGLDGEDGDDRSRLERWRFEVLGVEDFVHKPLDLGAFVELLTSIARDTGLAIEGELVGP